MPKRILQKSKDKQFVLTLPEALVEAKDWDKGQVLEIRFNERGNLELEEKK